MTTLDLINLNAKETNINFVNNAEYSEEPCGDIFEFISDSYTYFLVKNKGNRSKIAFGNYHMFIWNPSQDRLKYKTFIEKL